MLGNWGADQRRFGDGVGARSQMLRIGWLPPFGGYLEERIRMWSNQTYYGGDTAHLVAGVPAHFPYHHYYDFSIRYSRPWNGLTVGGEALGGRDVFGKSFSRLSGFVRYGGDARTRDDGRVRRQRGAGRGRGAPQGAEVFVDAGGNANRVKIRSEKGIMRPSSKPRRHRQFGPHFAVGARRAVVDTNDLGARAEIDEVDDHPLIRFCAPWTIAIDSTVR